MIADTGSMLYDEDELPIGGNVLFDLEGNVKRSNDYESISYGGDNGWLCVHNKKTNQTVYLNSDLKTELDLGMPMEQPVILRNACGGSKLIHAHMIG